MSHLTAADAKARGSASSLADLCELNARWLEHDGIWFRPFGDPLPEDDLAPLVTSLAAINRAGYLTEIMQDAESRKRFTRTGSAHVLQCAALSGYADARTAARIRAAADECGLLAIVHEPPGRFAWFPSNSEVQCVAWEDGDGEGFLGSRIPRRTLRDRWAGFGFCGRGAVDAVCESWQVTVIDPEPGREFYLWNTLSRALVGTRTDIS